MRTKPTEKDFDALRRSVKWAERFQRGLAIKKPQLGCCCGTRLGFSVRTTPVHR